MAQFAEFLEAKRAATAGDDDPDNARDVLFRAPDGTEVTVPWRKAREYDLDGLFGQKFGLTRKPKAEPKGGGDGDSDGKPTSVRDFFAGTRKTAAPPAAASGQ
jgi:hypothetical protein